MTDEQKKEICKAIFYGHTVSETAGIEEVSEKEVFDAVAWGEQNGYKDELEERWKELNREC